MKKISAILAMVFILVMAVMPVSAAELTGVALTASAETVEIGTEIIITVSCTPDTTGVLSADLLIGYDSTLVEFVESDTDANDVEGEGIYFGAYTKSSAPFYGELGTVTFKAIANGKANFTVALQDEYSAVKDTDKVSHTSDLVMTGVSVQIGSEPDSKPEVFTVDKVVDGNAVKVTVANSNLVAAGKIYVATFNGDVLVDCQVQDIKDDTLTFSGLAGELSTAKMFVWDNNNVPIEYVSAQ